MSLSPKPLVISGRKSWSGNDGNWSVIPIQIGSSKEGFQVLVSISSSDTLLPWPDYCSQSNIRTCGADRGVDGSDGFLTSNSSSWNASSSDNQGWDTIDLSLVGGPVLDQQSITGIDSATPFFGSLGLAPKLSKYSPLEFSGANSSNSSILQTLKTRSTTPSLSFGYLAGAAYRKITSPTYIVQVNTSIGSESASLVIGGYDASKYLVTPLSQNFSKNATQSLTIALNSITVDSALDGGSSPLATPIQVSIDSSWPYLELPRAICTRLESSFGLSFDPATGLYLVNSSTHSALERLNASLSFGFGNTTRGVKITLPYASLDLNASAPFYLSPTRYFPLRVSKNDSAAVLGRAFLQET